MEIKGGTLWKEAVDLYWCKVAAVGEDCKYWLLLLFICLFILFIIFIFYICYIIVIKLLTYNSKYN